MSDEFDDVKELNGEELSKGDSVILRYKVKNSIIYLLIGQILNIQQNITKIRFLRRRDFLFLPLMIYLLWIMKSGTARTAASFNFLL